MLLSCLSASLSSGFLLTLKAGMWLQSQGHLEASQSLPSATLCNALVSVKFCTCDVQDVNTMDEAVKHLHDKSSQFCFHSRAVSGSSWTTQQCQWMYHALLMHELLLQYFYACNHCNVAFPTELWLVYGFVERVLGIRPSLRKCNTCRILQACAGW